MLMIRGRLVDQEPEELAANLKRSAEQTIQLAHVIAVGGRDTSQIVTELEQDIRLLDVALEWSGVAMEGLFGEILESIHKCGQLLER